MLFRLYEPSRGFAAAGRARQSQDPEGELKYCASDEKQSDSETKSGRIADDGADQNAEYNE